MIFSNSFNVPLKELQIPLTILKGKYVKMTVYSVCHFYKFQNNLMFSKYTTNIQGIVCCNNASERWYFQVQSF